MASFLDEVRRKLTLVSSRLSMFEFDRSLSFSLSSEGSGSLSFPARCVTVANSSSRDVGVGDLTRPLAERMLCSREERSRLNVFGGGFGASDDGGEEDVDG